MPTAIEPLPLEDVPAPNRRRFTRQECDWLRDNGFLDGQYELINGEILFKMGQKPPHRSGVVLLRTWLASLFGSIFVLSQAPISVGEADNETNDPEPDAAVTVLPVPDYANRDPGPADLLLVAEVSDSTLRFDRVAKAALYARARIVEYWIVDIAGRQVFVHRQPEANGYTQITAYAEDESVATLTRPEDGVRVADLLPPAA